MTVVVRMVRERFLRNAETCLPREWSRWLDSGAGVRRQIYVGIHVALPGASRHHRGGDCADAWFDQHDAWRLAEPLAETHASARAFSVHRHHHYHGDDLGDGTLDQSRRRSLTSSVPRAYTPLSFDFFAFFFFVAE